MSNTRQGIKVPMLREMHTEIFTALDKLLADCRCGNLSIDDVKDVIDIVLEDFQMETEQ